MTIIDATRNADTPKRKDVDRLRYLVKRNGPKRLSNCY